VNEHPLATMLRDAAHGRFPPFDGLVEVVPSPGPPCDALVAFTGHFVLAADVDPNEIATRWPAGALTVPFSPASLVWLSDRIGLAPMSHDALLVSIGDGSGPPSWLHATDGDAHPPVRDASRFRSITSVWMTDDAGLVMVGHGVCDRWEVGFAVAPERRSDGLGRRLLAAARGLVPAGDPLWAQVAPGNAASMRSTIAAGFVPVGAEVLFARSPERCA
jgi:GNAT superfamily N-acetyltransferase